MSEEDDIAWDPEWDLDPAASQYADPEVFGLECFFSPDCDASL
jgi:hypothetical protein